MPLNSRDLWLVLKAQDQTNRALNTFSRNVRNAGNQVRAAQLEAAQAASLGAIAQAKLSNELARSQIGQLQYQKVLLARRYIEEQLHGSSSAVLDDIERQHRAIKPAIEDLRGQIAANDGVIAAERLKLQATRDSQAQLNAYNRSIQDHEKNLAHLSGTMQSVAQTATAAGFAFSAAGAVTILALSKTIDVAVEYERQVRATATQISNFSGNLNQLADIGREVARTIAVPFQEIQPALFDIFSSMDVNISEATDLLKEFSRAAVAGQTDISSVSRATIGILNAFGLSAADVNKILDLQFTLVQKGIGTYEEWNQRIGLVTPSAVRAGQSIETMVAALAASTRFGISAARSGTAVARAFDALSNPAAVKALKALGVSVQDAQGKFRPFNEVLHDFRDALMKMPEKDRLATILDVFKGAGGTIEARRFLQNILLGKDNLELFDQILNDTKNSAGAMDKAYGIMADGTAAKTQLLKNQWMLLQEAVGKALTPAFSTLIGWVIKLVDSFNKLDPATQKTIAMIALGVGIFLAILGPILLVIGAIAAFAAAFAVAGTAIVATVAVMGGLIIALGAIAAAFVLAYKHSLEFRVLLGQIATYFKLLKETIDPIAKDIVRAFEKEVIPPLERLWHVISDNVLPQFTIFQNFVVSQFLPKIKEAGNIVKDIAEKGFAFIGFVIDKIVTPAIRMATNWWKENKKEIEPLIPVIAQVVKWVLIVAGVLVGVLAVALIGPVVGAIGAVIAVIALLVAAFVYAIKFVKLVWHTMEDMTSWVKDVFMTVWNAIGSFFVSLWNGIVDVVTSVWDGIVSFFSGVWQAIQDIFNYAMNILKIGWDTFWNSSIGQLLIAIWNNILAFFSVVWETIQLIFRVAMKAITDLWNAVWPPIRDNFIAIWNEIKDFFGPIISGLWIEIQTRLAQIQALWNAVWTWIKDFFGSIWNTFVDQVKGRVSDIQNAISSAWNAIKSLTISAWNGLVDAVKDKVNLLKTTVSKAIDDVKGFFAGAGSWLFNAGKEIINGLINGITSMINRLTDKMNELAKKIKDFLPGSPVKIGPLRVLNRGHAGGEIVRMIAEGMVRGLPAVESAANTVANQILGSGFTTSDNAYNPYGTGAGGKTINQEITVNTQEIDPRRHSAELGWELARVM